MHQAIPYRSWKPHTTHNTTPITTYFTIINNPDSSLINKSRTVNTSSSVSSKNLATDAIMVRDMVKENAVIVFARRGCCMSHVVKRLLLGLGVNPALHEVEEREEAGVVRELEAIAGGDGGKKVQLPAVFIGGKLFGGLDRLMATHITGELVPILKEAGALWL